MISILSESHGIESETIKLIALHHHFGPPEFPSLEIKMKTILRTNAMPISTAFGDSRSASSEEQTPWSAPNYSFNGWSESERHVGYRSVSWSHNIHYFSTVYLDENGDIE